MYCGNQEPQPVETPGNVAKIRFRTDSSVSGTGFSLSYQAESGEYLCNSPSLRDSADHCNH